MTSIMILSLSRPFCSFFYFLLKSSREKLRRGDSNFVSAFVKKHLAINMFPYTSFEPNLIYSIEGMDGRTVNLKKNSEGQLSVSLKIGVSNSIVAR